MRDDSAGRREDAQRMRRRAVEELDEDAGSPTQAELRRGWCLEGQTFRERMLALLDGAGGRLRRGGQIDGAVRRSHCEDEASRFKGDPRKIALASIIRQRTIVLVIGSPAICISATSAGRAVAGRQGPDLLLRSERRKLQKILDA